MSQKTLEMKYTLNGTDRAFPSAAEKIIIHDFTYEAKRDGLAPTISATIHTSTNIDGELTNASKKDSIFVTFNNMKFYLQLDEIPQAAYSKDSVMWTYELAFKSERYILENIFFYDVVNDGTIPDRPVSNNTNIVFFGGMDELRRRLHYSFVHSGISEFQRDTHGNIVFDDDGLPVIGSGYKIIIDEGVESEEKLISAANIKINEAIDLFSSVFGKQYYFSTLAPKEIHIGTHEYQIGDSSVDAGDTPVEYGSFKHLTSIQRIDSTDNIINRITGVGSSENIPYYYPNPTEKGTLAFDNNITGLALRVTNGKKLCRFEQNSHFGLLTREAARGDASGVTLNRVRLYSDGVHAYNLWTAINATVSVNYPLVTIEAEYTAPSNKFYNIVMFPDSVRLSCTPTSTSVNVDFKFESIATDDKLHPQNILKTSITELTYYNRVVNGTFKVYVIYTFDFSEIFRRYHVDALEITCPNNPQINQVTKKTYFNMLQIPPHLYSGHLTAFDTKTWDNNGIRPTISDGSYVFTLPVNSLRQYKTTHITYTGNGINITSPCKMTIELNLQKRISGQYRIEGDSNLHRYDKPFTDITDDAKLTLFKNGVIVQRVNLHSNTKNIIDIDSSGTWTFQITYTDNDKAYNDESMIFTHFNVIFKDSIIAYVDTGDILFPEECGFSDNGFVPQVSTLYLDSYYDKMLVSKYLTPQPNLMPKVYIDSDGEQRFYPALNNTYRVPGETLIRYYQFDNVYNQAHPFEAIQDFEDIKPTIAGMTVGGHRIDKFMEIAFDDNDNNDYVTDDNGGSKPIHPVFFAKLRPLGFNLFDLATDTGDMTISFTSGSCGSCNFKIMVGDKTKKNLVQVDNNGNLLRDSDGNVICGRKGQSEVESIDSQQDTTSVSVWIALEKETETFGILMPNVIGTEPHSGLLPTTDDTFVITNILMPDAYLRAAELKLQQALIKYMADNNNTIWNFSITFSRIFLEENPDVLERLSENTKFLLRYNGSNYTRYASSFSYRMSKDSALPEISVELDDPERKAKTKGMLPPGPGSDTGTIVRPPKTPERYVKTSGNSNVTGNIIVSGNVMLKTGESIKGAMDVIGRNVNMGIRRNVSNLETTVGDDSGGLVKSVNDSQAVIAALNTELAQARNIITQLSNNMYYIFCKMNSVTNMRDASGQQVTIGVIPQGECPVAPVHIDDVVSQQGGSSERTD